MENVFMVIFEVESEAYQAFSEIKNSMASSRYIVPRMALIKRSGKRIIPCDGYDVKLQVSDTELGGMVGMFVGMLGGPLGVLLGGVTGAAIGSTSDDEDLEQALTLLEKASDALNDGEIALIALVQEARGGSFAGKLAKFKAKIYMRDAAEVAVEISEAIELQKKLAKEAKERMRKEKIASAKQKLEEKRAELRKEFQDVRENLKIVQDEYDAKTNPEQNVDKLDK